MTENCFVWWVVWKLCFNCYWNFLIFLISTSRKIIHFTVFAAETTSNSYNTCGSSINIKKVITTHNKTILDNSKKLNKTKCKRVNKNTFPLNREYQVENIIYQASLNSNKPYFDEKYDKGSCETTFKKWFTNHKKSFENKQYKNETELSNEVWNLKSINNNAEIAWKFYEDGPL